MEQNPYSNFSAWTGYGDFFFLLLIGFRHEHVDGRTVLNNLFRPILALLLLLFICISFASPAAVNSVCHSDRASTVLQMIFHSWATRAWKKKKIMTTDCCCASPCKSAALTIAAAAAGWLMDSDLLAWRLDTLLTKWLFNNGPFELSPARVPLEFRCSPLSMMYARWILNSFTARSLVREISNHSGYTKRARSAADKLHLQKSAQKFTLTRARFSRRLGFRMGNLRTTLRNQI